MTEKSPCAAIEGLHAQIMNLRCTYPDAAFLSGKTAYELGCLDTRHAAAKLVSAALATPAGGDAVPVAPASQSGWQLVPVEPTTEMLLAYSSASMHNLTEVLVSDDPDAVDPTTPYKAMLAASPRPAGAPHQPTEMHFDLITANSSLEALESMGASHNGYRAEITQNVNVLRAQIADADYTIKQLGRALREATEPPTFMGEPALPAAFPRPSTEGAEQEARKLALEALILDTLHNYRCMHQRQDDDAGGMPLADVLSDGSGTVKTGLEEIELIADELCAAISALRSIPEGEGMDARLRDGVRQITLSLREREWADLLTADPDLAALEAEVRALVEGGR